jgi:hypothetical protein
VEEYEYKEKADAKLLPHCNVPMQHPPPVRLLNFTLILWMNSGRMFK